MGEHSTRGTRVISLSHQVFNFFAMKINSAIQLTAYERKQLQLVKEYVDAHLHEALDPGELVLSFDISVYKFKAGFVQLCGRSFSEYLKSKRMEKAMELLCNSNKINYEIAMECGYKDTSAFVRAFRKWYGQTPDRARKL